jgi:Kef-type K+ transport system membrane component KefB
MKKEKRTILVIALIIAVLACIASLLYAILFDSNVPVEEQSAASAFWAIAYWTAFVLTLCSAVIGIVFLIKDALAVKARYLIILIATIVVFFVSYFLADASDVPAQLFEKTGSALGTSKWISAGLYTVYILFAGVIITLIYSAVSKLIKK